MTDGKTPPKDGEGMDRYFDEFAEAMGMTNVCDPRATRTLALARVCFAAGVISAHDMMGRASCTVEASEPATTRAARDRIMAVLAAESATVSGLLPLVHGGAGIAGASPAVH